MGVFNFIGTIASGWLTDRFDPRRLLLVYYGFRGVSLLFLPFVHDSMSIAAFAILFGLDYIATVPPTVALVADRFGQHNVGIVYGWVFAAHMLGAAIAAWVAGIVREQRRRLRGRLRRGRLDRDRRRLRGPRDPAQGSGRRGVDTGVGPGMTKKRKRPTGQTIGSILVGFDQEVFRTLPPAHELVAKSQPVRGVSGDGDGIEVVFPDDVTTEGEHQRPADDTDV